MQLTQDQQAGLDAFISFMLDASQNVFVLEGFSGTGKTTLVRRLLNDLPKVTETMRMLDPKYIPREVVLTATTNKAAEALRELSGMDVSTIHSHLGLSVRTDYTTGKSTLFKRRDAQPVEYQTLFIDEASFIDEDLLEFIFKMTKKCKIVFIGDPAQLTPVGYSNCPVFEKGYPTARLQKVVRHDGPILDLATQFRQTVLTGKFFNFVPDGKAIVHLSNKAFEAEVIQEFSRPDFRHNDAKMLAWRNKTVVHFNRAVSDQVTGSPEFQLNDYAICNYFLSTENGVSFKTDQTVQITQIGPQTTECSVPGRWIWVDGRAEVFLPDDVTKKKSCLDHLRSAGALKLAHWVEQTWIDLRPAYASTINKSQGSTYRRVFIDLDDLRGCPDGNLLARLLYVAVSRASEQVILTGDIV